MNDNRVFRDAISRRWSEVQDAVMRMSSLKRQDITMDACVETMARMDENDTLGFALLFERFFLIVPIGGGQVDGFAGSPSDNDIRLPERDGWSIVIAAI